VIEIQENAELVRTADVHAEYRAACRLCAYGNRVTFSEAEVKEHYLKHGDRWIFLYFRDDLGWDITHGICRTCKDLILQVRGRLN
jgi:hypothetical protein